MAEIKLATHIACHSSIRTVDHLGEIASEIAKRKLEIHRTKCSALIKRAIAPVLKEDLLNDLKNQPYSLLVDESTDITQDKQLCVVVRYYSKSCKRIFSTFFYGF